MNFLKYIKHNYRTITLGAYLLPILFSVIVSLAHVVSFWEITNPVSWAIFLSVAIEVAVLSSIAASRMSKSAWVPFIIVTFIQIVGNIFFSFTNIDVDGKLFKSWVELVDPIYQWFGAQANDLVLHKRIVATFSGAVIPLIAITFFNFFIHAVRMNPKDLEIGLETPEENAVPTQEVSNVEQTTVAPTIEPEITATAVKTEEKPEILEKEPEITVEAVKNEQEFVNQEVTDVNNPESVVWVNPPRFLEYPEMGTTSYPNLPEPIIVAENAEPELLPNAESTEIAYVQPIEPVVIQNVENEGYLDSTVNADAGIIPNEEQPMFDDMDGEPIATIVDEEDEKKNLTNQ
jgi:hypothetical protein